MSTTRKPSPTALLKHSHDCDEGGLAFCNIVFALSYCANGFLYDHGLAHGVSSQDALKVHVARAIVLTMAQIAVIALLLSSG